KVRKIEFGTNPITHATQNAHFTSNSSKQTLIFKNGALDMPLSREFTLFEKNRGRSVNKEKFRQASWAPGKWAELASELDWADGGRIGPNGPDWTSTGLG
ncbi:hypothetical protein CRG98_049642, partial [Punica granatum]